MRVGILGFGALGALYADYFSSSPEAEVFFIASGERYERIRNNPLTVNGRLLDIPVERAGTGESAEPADLLLVAVKHHQLAAALEDARGHVGDSTILLSVMNGIESEETIGTQFGTEHLLYAVALGMDPLREGNRVTYTTPGKLLLGRAQNDEASQRGEGDEDLARVQRLCVNTGLPWETPEDMIRNLWWKFMINIGINQSSAVIGGTYGTFVDSEDARSVLVAAMEEVIAVASHRGVSLYREDIDRFVEQILPSMSREGKTSMLQDVEAGRKTEVEMFAGTLVRMGEGYGVDTPVNATLLSLLKAIEFRYLA
jgi:2-dehydropantoate 2-reductase